MEKERKNGYNNIKLLDEKEGCCIMMENKFIGLDVDDMIFGRDGEDHSQR